MSVSAFQAEWDLKTSGFTLVNPSSIVPVDYKTRMECTLGEFSFVYVDSFKHVYLPVIRIDFNLKTFTLSQIGSRLKLLTSMEVKGNFNNSRTAKWEPFLERLMLDAEIISEVNKTDIHLAGGLEGSSEGVYFNISEELIEVMLHCFYNASTVMSVQQTAQDGGKLTSAFSVSSNDGKLTDNTEEKDITIYDSQFLIRNKSGYDVFIQTLGDKKSEKIKVRNFTEKVVNFIILDEFSTKDSVNREVILTFGPEIQQKSPIIFSVDKFKQISQDVQGHSLIITVKKEKLKRVAVISSKLLLQNYTSLPLQMMIFSQDGISNKVDIPNDNERHPIDFDKVKESITISLNEAVSQIIPLETMSSQNQTIKVPLQCSAADYNNMIMDVYSKGLVTFIDLKPALKVVNLCPVPIHFEISCKNEDISHMVFRSKPVEIYKFDPYKVNCAMKLTVNEHYSLDVDITKFLWREQSRTIVLTSIEGSNLKIHLELEHNKKLNMITIYSKFNIINETGLVLDILSFNPSISGASQRLVGNGTNTVLFQSKKSHDTFVIKANPKTFEETPEFPAELKPSIRGTCFFPKNISYNLNTRVSGGSEATFYEYNFAIIPNVVKLADGILTKTITITPQFVVMNDTQYSFNFIQAGANDVARVEPRCRKPVLWRSPEKLLSIQLLEHGKQYLYTDFFEMDKPSYYELYVKEVENEDVKVFLCVKVSTIDNITYFQVSHLQAEEVTKVLMNNTPYKMSVRSKTWKHEPIQQIEPQTKIYYAQNYPNKAGSVILVHFYNSEKQMITIEIDFLIITTAPRHFDCGEADKMVQVSVRFIGSNKVIEILLISREQLIHQTQNRPDEVITIKYSYNIIDLSFMQLPRKSPRRELANVFLYNTYGLIEVKNMTNITLKGCVEHFQIDNNSNQNTSFPVVLRRVNEKLRKNIPNKKFLEWNIAFENPSRSTHLYVSNLAVNLGNLELMLEEEYLDQVMVYFSEIAGRIQREKAHTHFDFIQRKYFDQIDIDDGFDFNKKVWEFTQIDKKNNYVYIDNLCLPKIWCLLSYYQDASSTIDKDFALVSLLGVAVGGFESASIEIKGLHKDNMYQPVDILFEDLARYYKAQLLKVGYAILGSLNILGNPSQIIREFRGDIDNVLDSHGDDSAKVIAEGAGVIAKNTMAGGINNTTGSFAGVMSLMTADKQFMKERGLRRRKKAKNVLQGFEQGANSLFHGITNGISGIVSQPYYEIKSQGVYGVFPGLFKGFTGIITKPLSGLLDTISKTAEGIQNTAKGRLENIQRARPPRAFYNEDMVVKEFSFDDAVYYDTMKTVDKRNDSLIIGFSNLRNKDKSVYMALTTAYISLIDEDLRTTQIHMNKITRILQTDGNSICIEYKSSNESHRITLTVEEGQFNAKNIVEEMHLQIGLIVAKT